MKLILILSLIALCTKDSEVGKLSRITTPIYQENMKKSAFQVLTTKCNVCHATKKKQDIFTLENMDSLANTIHEQVFMKKKMPKGRKNVLTEKESDALKNWLDFTIDK